MWEYLTVFVLAATPLVELLVVIPLGIGYGLDPVAVAALAAVGNSLPILLIAAVFERWRQRRSLPRADADRVGAPESVRGAWPEASPSAERDDVHATGPDNARFAGSDANRSPGQNADRVADASAAAPEAAPGATPCPTPCPTPCTTPGATPVSPPGATSASAPSRSRRRQRAQRLWIRYGTPGLALLAPLVTGAHLAAITALALGSPRLRLTGWLLLSILLWTVAVTLGTLAGIEGFRQLSG